MYTTTGSLENRGDHVLTAVQRVRQIGSFAKIDATVALAKDVLNEQPAVVIFTSFVSVAKSVHKQLAEAGWEGELLTGETPGNKRHSMVDYFQVRRNNWNACGSDPLCSHSFHGNVSFAFVGGSVTCVYPYVWCWWSRLDIDCGAHHHFVRQTVDFSRGTTGRGSCETNWTDETSDEHLDGGV